MKNPLALIGLMIALTAPGTVLASVDLVLSPERGARPSA